VKEFNPYKKGNPTEKVVATIRIDSTILEEIDKLASNIDISRNELIIQCIEYALENLSKDSKEKKQ